jgi:hypothetical protein
MVSGFPLPMSFAHNLDDPRSPHCRMNRPGGWDQFAAYTARVRKFSGPEEYAAWIAKDARDLIAGTIAEQMFRPDPPSVVTRIARRVRRLATRD